MTTFIDIFSGVGGLSLGLGEAGFTHLGSIDNWGDAVETHRTNFPSVPVFHNQIENVDLATLKCLSAGGPRWVVGGPPCQGFSTVGRRDRSDPRNTLVRSFGDVVKGLQPEGFVLENVLGLRDMRFVDELCSMFAGIGYRVTPIVFTSAEYGVPQLRRRVFFIGDRHGRGFIKPAATHTPNRYVSVWDAIGDLPALRPGEERSAYESRPFSDYQRRMRNDSTVIQGHKASRHPAYLVEAISYIPDGGNRRNIPDHLQPRSGYHNSYARLFSLAPAVAVTQNMGKPSGTRCIHPFQDRGLTAREGARLQGFPDTFHFAGGTMSQRLQVANAVPPILARAVGEALLREDSWVETPADAEDVNQTFQEIRNPTPDIADMVVYQDAAE